MRVFEGAGIGGLKGIPRETGEGIVRPILDVWKERYPKLSEETGDPISDRPIELRHPIRAELGAQCPPPLLVKRYGKAVKKRIFTLGERFRELDDYLEADADRWIRRNVKNLWWQGEPEC